MENKIETPIQIAIQKYFTNTNIRCIETKFSEQLKCNLYYVYTYGTCYEISEMQVLAANKSWQYHKR